MLVSFAATATACLLFASHSLRWQVRADPQLVFVDDEDGDPTTGVKPTYATQNSSVAWNAGESCSICAIKLDTAQVSNGTYHDITAGGTYYPAADFEFSFTGYAVNVYFVLAGNNLAADVVVDTTVDILIDDEVVSQFAHDASQFSDYQYNQMVYANASMINTNHTITIRTAGNEESVILFDYLTYMKDDDTIGASDSDTGAGTGTATVSQTQTIAQTQTDVSSASSSSTATSSASHSSTGAIAGGVAGGVFALIAIGGFILFCRRRKRASPETVQRPDNLRVYPFSALMQRRPDSSAVLTPFTESSPYTLRKPVTSLDTSSPVLTMPYSAKRLPSIPNPVYIYSPGTEPYDQDPESPSPSQSQSQYEQTERTQSRSSRPVQVQDQVQYLLAEIDRLRARVTRSHSHAHIPDGTGVGGASKVRRGSLSLIEENEDEDENAQPPEYTRDARGTPSRSVMGGLGSR